MKTVVFLLVGFLIFRAGVWWERTRPDHVPTDGDK